MIHALRIRGFRRYRDASFELRPGLNFIDGPNNAGKTTLLYAIEYALFGRVGGFGTQISLLHPGARGMGVELIFTGRDGLRYRLQRVHAMPPRARSKVVGHFTLKKQSDEEDQAEQYLLSSDFGDTQEDVMLALQRILGLTPRLFDVAVHLRQGRIASILSGAPELDKVLGVTAAVVAAEEMRALALEQEKEAAALPLLEEKRTHIESECKNAAVRLVELNEEARVRAVRSKALSSELSKVLATEQQMHDIKTATHKATQLASTWQQAHEAELQAGAELQLSIGDHGHAAKRASSLQAADDAIELASASATQAQQEQSESRELRRALDLKLGDLGGRIERQLAMADQASCQSCGQAVDLAAVRAELALWQETRSDVSARAIQLEATIARAHVDENSAATQRELAIQMRVEAAGQIEALQSLEATAAKATSALAAALEELAESTASLHTVLAAFSGNDDLERHTVEFAMATRPSEISLKLAGLDSDTATAKEATLVARTKLEVESEGLAEQQAERAERHEQAQEHIAELDREKAQVNTEIQRLQKALTVAEDVRVLAAGFKDLQVSLRDTAAKTLAQKTLELHKRLSGNDQELAEVRIDPAKYAVYVTPKDIGKDVPSHLFQGGGHQLLLGLAFKLAVAGLVGARSFLLLDEPTYGLDKERRDQLLGRLAGLDVAEQLIVITHHDVGDVEGHRIRAVRDGKASFVEMPSAVIEGAIA